MAVSRRTAPIFERSLKLASVPKGYDELKALLEEQKALVSETPRVFEAPENRSWEKATATSEDMD